MLGITSRVTYGLVDMRNLPNPHTRSLTIKAPSFSILITSILLLAKPLADLLDLTTGVIQDLPGPHTDIKISVGCDLSGNRLVKTMQLELMIGLLWKRMMILQQGISKLPLSLWLGLDTIILMPWPEDREASTSQQNL